MMAGLNFFPDDKMEEDDAKAGRPAPSKPSPATVAPIIPSTPTETVKNEEPEVAGVTPPEVGGTAEVTPQPDEVLPANLATINSSTHRAAHARLVRKMSSVTEADCPNMCKLWSGSRKDSCGGNFGGNQFWRYHGNISFSGSTPYIC